jgi:hypothetical protein
LKLSVHPSAEIADVRAAALAEALFGAAAKAWREIPNASNQPQTFETKL